MISLRRVIFVKISFAVILTRVTGSGGLILIRAVNSVGSECHLDRVEVTGSSPVQPTKQGLQYIQHIIHAVFTA